MPADLLAALAYQESHWDPSAESPTGVRGIMMLTRNTAESLGVMDRLNPAAAIDGGARYLADRHRRLPDTIPEPDRTFLALASYNIGRGHLLDARQLAREQALYFAHSRAVFAVKPCRCLLACVAHSLNVSSRNLLTFIVPCAALMVNDVGNICII